MTISSKMKTHNLCLCLPGGTLPRPAVGLAADGGGCARAARPNVPGGRGAVLASCKPFLFLSLFVIVTVLRVGAFLCAP